MRVSGWARIGILFGALILTRGIALSRYPPPDIDEGFWSLGAKNQVKFHDALMDHRLHPFLSPTTFALLCAEFSIVEPSLLTARCFSVVAGLVSVGVFWRIERRSLPKRPWLPALLFGLNSFVVIVNRQMFIDTHQLIWLLIAADFWLRPGRKAPIGAAVCFALAFLTKINSLYVLPAFLWSAPDCAGKERWRTPISFIAVLALVTAVGYLADYAASPSEFKAAFSYEMGGRHFLNDGVAFHLGRFGLHPMRLRDAATALAKGFPLVIPMACVGIGRFARGRRADRSDRLFVAWLTVGLPFALGQIYIPERYLLTLAPPLVHFASRALDDLFHRDRRIIAVALLTLALTYHLARIGRGIERGGADRSYADAVDYVTRRIPRDDAVLAAPYVGISLPHRAYDFFRMLRPYDEKEPSSPIAEVVRRHRIRALIVDREWRFYMTRDVDTFLRERCVRLATFGTISIYRVDPPRTGIDGPRGDR